MEKIVIVGATGSGKTTLAFEIAAKLDARMIDLDDLYWRPGWKEAPTEEFRTAVKTAIDTPRWVTAGNYRVIQDITWPQADTVIWLDYSLPRVFTQLALRSLRRVWSKTEICNGNQETIGKLLSRDSIILWLFESYGKQKKEREKLFADPERHSDMRRFIRLKNPAQTRAFLKSLNP